MQKKCSKCQRHKPVDVFYKNRTKPDGLSTECKECVKFKVAAYTKAHISERSDYHRSWRQKNRIRSRELNSESLKRHRDRANIRQKFKAAVSCGHVVKIENCLCCGSAGTEPHHASYAPEMWDCVTWLCRRCHRQCHSGETAKRAAA